MLHSYYMSYIQDLRLNMDNHHCIAQNNYGILLKYSIKKKVLFLLLLILLVWVPLPHVPEHAAQPDQPDQVPLTIAQTKTSVKNSFHLKNTYLHCL